MFQSNEGTIVVLFNLKEKEKVFDKIISFISDEYLPKNTRHLKQDLLCAVYYADQFHALLNP